MSKNSSKRKKQTGRSSLRHVATIQRALLRWYEEKGRDLPWRHTRDPYRVLVSEIMLQQTQVDRVIPKYRNFLRLFPTVQKLSRAPRASVIRAWAGLGYNRRAVYLHEVAKKVLRDFCGRVPTTIDELRMLPGVGDYTAGAVAAFTGGSTKAFLDTNIKRVVGRLFFNTKSRRLPAEKKLSEYAQSLVPTKKGDAYFWHHALMDLGATVCVARTPTCAQCPLQKICPFPPFRDAVKKSHYAKRQPTFKDSDRFWRGMILSILREHPKGIALSPLLRVVAIPRHRMARLLGGLKRDGLLSRMNNAYMLPR
ncbi:A/G-specific adenine glycosylase [Candidatus Uhrbacteria bacterium]|nr:A/G-specific adenine glycosylase [Candidatus Uhrbacteria bacterium]